MKIGIIGGGSIGLLFAAYLNKVCHVTIYTRTIEQAEEINQCGLIIKKGSVQTKQSVEAKPAAKWTGAEELSIIAVKQYQLDSIVEKISGFPPNSGSFLFIQNGMGHLEKMNLITAINIYLGSVEHGALKLNGHTVSHNGEGVTNIAVYHGKQNLIKELAELVPAAFPIVLQEDYYLMLENKLIINAVINPLTAILRVKNGELLDNPYYFHSVCRLFNEIAAILELDSPEIYFEQIKAVCRKTAENRSSMLKDIEAGRKTEADAILGFLLNRSMEKDRTCPILDCMYHLIKGMELDRGGNSLIYILSSIISVFFTIPLLGSAVLYILFKAISKDPQKSVHKAVDYSAVLFVISVHFLIIAIWGKSLFWFIILIMIFFAMAFSIVHWKVKGDIVFHKVLKGFWRFNFLFFFIAYILLTLYGLIERAMTFTFSS